MTFRSRFVPKLLVGSVTAVALSVAVGASASVSAQSVKAADPPVVASQCDHPGPAHFGFANKQACLAAVANHARGMGVGSGYGGNGNGNGNANIAVTISNVVGSVVNVTVNFFNSVF